MENIKEKNILQFEEIEAVEELNDQDVAKGVMIGIATGVAIGILIT